MLFVLCAGIGPRNHVLDGGADLSIGKGNIEGDRAAIAKYRDALP